MKRKTQRAMARNASGERITVTLAPGQKEVLEEIAQRNNATIAFVIRKVLARFIDEKGGQPISLEFQNKQDAHDKDRL